MQKYEMVATTLKGLEQVLAKELEELGGEEITILKRAVTFKGDDSLLYKSNMALRTAMRVLVPIDEFEANNEEELYQYIKRFKWENIIDIEQTFAIDATVSGEIFKHSKYISLKAKDAIADRFRMIMGIRPNVDPINADIAIRLHINNNQINLSLDSSGLSLDRRGYRRNTTEAPINEVLAAGIILKSGWTEDIAFYDPMSGSGTFSIEAALIGTHTPPNINRSFSFCNWYDFDEILFEKCKSDLENTINTNIELNIFSRDLLKQNIEIIAQNVENANMEDHINLKKGDFFELDPVHPTGILFLNPPYGIRLKLDDSIDFYKKIGDTMKQKYPGFDAWIISSDLNAIKYIGLKADLKEDVMNGGLDAKLLKYKLYSGRQ